MGIAGVALIFALFCVFRSVKAVVTYFSWRNKEIVDAEVGELIKSEYVGKKSNKYIYSVVLNTSPEKTETQYEAIAENNSKLPVKTGDKVEVYYDPNKEGKDCYRIIKELKKELWQWPLFGAVCIAVFIGCILLAGALTK